MANNLDLTFRCAAISCDVSVTQAEIYEALSEPTRAVIHCLSRDDLDGEAALGKEATIEARVDGATIRRFHLLVTGFRSDGAYRSEARRYVFELEHELALLGLRSDVRMFQEKRADEIVSEVLRGAGVPDAHVQFSLQRKPEKRTYCVQYRETDLDFVKRLLEHEGIFYVIEHDDESAKITFADARSTFEPIPGDPVQHLVDDDMHGGGIHELVVETSVTPGRVTLSDYNLETPSTDLKVKQGADGMVLGDWFEYPAGHQTPSEGQVLAKLRMEAFLAQRTVVTGRCDNHGFRAGALFTLDHASREDLNQEYLLRSIEHRFVAVAHDDGGHDEGDAYHNRFSAIPSARTYRPPVVTPRASVKGLHSAVVTGPAGSEIHTDRLGRMKGKLFWDRVGKEDDKSSCWIRVVQLPIGGSMALARVGWEMSVAYLDGDPDRPVAVSRLYNTEKTSPYAYPAAKTRMSLQTASSPGGGKTNEIRMEDGGGGQEFFLNASKDYLGETGNNKTEKVGVDEKREVGSNSEWTVVSNQSITIGGSESTTVSGAATLTVTADRTKSVGGSETVSVSSDEATTITGSDTEVTGGSHTTLAALGVNRTSVGSHSLTVGGSMIDAAVAGVGVVVAGARSETVGGAKIGVSGGSVTESVFGALARTVGGVAVNAAGANRKGTSKGASALTVGGVVMANAGGQVTLKAKKISIKVLGVANFLGGGGILTLTPGSASFVGLVGLDASGSIKISGNPNLVG